MGKNKLEPPTIKTTHPNGEVDEMAPEKKINKKQEKNKLKKENKEKKKMNATKRR